MRININMDEGLVKKIDAKADKLFVSRSAYISMVVAQRIQNEELLENVPDLVNAVSGFTASLDTFNSAE